MAKLYGGRWRCTDDAQLGSGGQGDVFRVVDTSGKLPGMYALKRVRNPKRHDRFRAEIEAVAPTNIETSRISAVQTTFDPEHSLSVPFRGNEWGTLAERLDAALSEALETFLEQVDKHGY